MGHLIFYMQIFGIFDWECKYPVLQTNYK